MRVTLCLDVLCESCEKKNRSWFSPRVRFIIDLFNLFIYLAGIDLKCAKWTDHYAQSPFLYTVQACVALAATLRVPACVFTR
jgi:hypothetical protein